LDARRWKKRQIEICHQGQSILTGFGWRGRRKMDVLLKPDAKALPKGMQQHGFMLA
jgi:hypothetical protein